MPDWLEEFDDSFEVPEKILHLVGDGEATDLSWHNDESPSFGIHSDADEGICVRIWVGRPGDAIRFIVTIKDENREYDPLYQGNDVDEAIRLYRRHRDVYLSLWKNSWDAQQESLSTKDPAVPRATLKTTTEWTPENSDAAIARGWEIWETNRDLAEEAELEVDGKPYGHRPFELQALDDGPLTDQGAWNIVNCGARNGDPLCIQALAFLAEHSPDEHAAIIAKKETL